MKRIAKTDIHPPSPVGIIFTRQPLSDDSCMVFQFYMLRAFSAVDVCWVNMD
jgi:hypothetical protein